jgi:hypothetical protein
LGEPPIKIKCLVPSFDNVVDVALEKLLEPQRILFPQPASDIQLNWIGFLEKQKALIECQLDEGWVEVGPLLPKSMTAPRKGFTKDHKGIELKNGSSIWFATSEQGWQAQRGGEQDILSIDEEGDERVTDEVVRGLRNAKGGGKIIAGLTPPYMPGQGPTWTKEKVLEASLVDNDIHVVRACMADNPAITDTFIKRFSKGKTKKQVAVQVYGDYPSWGDLVHPGFQDRLWSEDTLDGHLLPNETPLPENFAVDWIMAFDWHPSKPCAAVFGYVDSDGNIVFFDELDLEWAEGKEIGDLAEGFLNIEGHPHHKRRFRRWQDPSAKNQYNAIKRGFNAWDAFRKEGILTAAGKNRDPLVGTSIVNEYLNGNMTDHPRVFFYERMKYTRQFMGNHYWKRDESGVGKPDPKWSDYPICVRYILQEIGWKRARAGRKKLPYYSYQKEKDDKVTFNLGKYI